MHYLRIHLRPRRRRPGIRHSPRNRFRRPPARLDMPSLRRRQGTLREVQITPHAPRCRGLSHAINILATENPNSFARMLDFREIRAISHQSSHPRRKTSHFFCKDSHPARDFVHNSPRFTDNHLPSDHVVRKTRHFTDKVPHITIA